MERTQSEVLQLALEHRDRIWGYLRSLSRDRARTEDLFQQTFLVICRKWEAFTPGTNFLAWALRIARYEFLASVDPNLHREVSMESELLEDILVQAPVSGAAPDRRRGALQICLQQLATRARKAFQLRYGEGLANAELAVQLGTSETALYALLSRTRRTLKACIEQRLLREPS